MFEQTFRNIDEVLRKEAGCTMELRLDIQHLVNLYRRKLAVRAVLKKPQPHQAFTGEL